MPPATPACLTVITGASRGLGEAMARQCLAAGDQVLAISRGHSPLLAAQAGAGRLTQWSHDLAEPAPVADRLAQWLAGQAAQPWRAVRLINNAGVIAPLSDLEAIDPGDTARALRVGLEAPMLLTAAFLAATRGWPAARRVFNISSGLGRRAMAGSASYCAAKAGLDHFSRCVALEQAAQPDGARIVSIAPGVIDTDMQRQLRGADPARFADQASFAQLHAQGRLSGSEDTAARLLAYLARPDFGATVVADIREPG